MGDPTRLDLQPETGAVVFFDGVCNLCNAAVRFVIKRDPAKTFRFAPFQGSTANELLRGVEFPEHGAVALVDGGRVVTGSTAVLRIARRMRWPYPVFYGLILVPRRVRDGLYDLVARNRYRWFGKRETCVAPGPEHRGRFLS